MKELELFLKQKQAKPKKFYCNAPAVSATINDRNTRQQFNLAAKSSIKSEFHIIVWFYSKRRVLDQLPFQDHNEPKHKNRLAFEGKTERR